MATNKEQIRMALISAIDSRGLSQAEASKKLGVSPATINNIINRKYVENAKLNVSEDLWRKIAQWAGVSGWNAAATRDFKRINVLCANCQSEGRSRAISFDPGSGKTYALKSYASSHHNVYYIECDEYWGKKDFLNELRKQMGLVETGLTISEMVASIIEYLNRDEMPLVIIDEADKLKDAVLNFFKTFYNKSNSGFILCGAPYFAKRIMKGVRLQKQAYQEIHSRLGGEFFQMKGLNQSDIRNVCEANGVKDDNDIQRVINYTEGDLRRAKTMIEELKLEQKAV